MLKFWRLLLTLFFLFFLVVIIFFSYCTFRVNNSAMSPLVSDGDMVLVNRFGDFDRGDVVIFSAPNNSKSISSGRIIGASGDMVDINHGQVYLTIDQHKYDLAEDFLSEDNRKRTLLSEPGSGFATTKDAEGRTYLVPEEAYFILGDNRIQSEDSRHWEKVYVEKSDIVGKVEYVIWPFKRFVALPKVDILDQ